MQNLEENFLKAYNDFSDAIFRHCYFRIYDRELAKDVTQETFTKTWQYIINGGEIENIRAFLYKTATNLIIDHARKKKPLSLEDLQEKGFEPASGENEKLEKTLDAKRAIKVIEQLGPDYREAVTMRYIDDLSPKEIAHILEESENVVSVRIHRGLKKLKELIK